MDIGGILNTLIGTVVGGTLALWSSYYMHNREYKERLERSATLLFQDIEESRKGLKVAISIEGVLKKPFSIIVNNNYYAELIVDLSDKLEVKHTKELMTFYGNLSQLQNIQKEYWSEEDKEHLRVEYFDALRLIFALEQQQKFLDSFNKVKNISIFRDDREL